MWQPESIATANAERIVLAHPARPPVLARLSLDRAGTIAPADRKSFSAMSTMADM